jgi:hypothetical protein
MLRIVTMGDVWLLASGHDADMAARKRSLGAVPFQYLEPSTGVKAGQEAVNARDARRCVAR